VDFRALDTLGEITVLAVAGFGVYALLRLKAWHQREVEK
jgi:multicomponent Na+:H+ antiporter subunit A